MKTPAPSPRGTNQANLFLAGSAAAAVRHGRALHGMAFDQKFGMARDQDDQRAAKRTDELTDILRRFDGLAEVLKPAVLPGNFSEVWGAIRELRGLVEQHCAQLQTQLNIAENTNTVEAMGDDEDGPVDTAGRPNRGGAPSEAKGTISQDRRPTWLKPVDPNAQGKALERAKKNMARIGNLGKAQW